MRVFVTGATGFIGSAVVDELLRCGHNVLGLARSDASAAKLVRVGAAVHRGDLEDFEGLTAGAAQCDAVVHTGFVHEFHRYKEVCELDRRVIAALGAGLVGTRKPIVVTSGTLTQTGRTAVEEDRHPPGASETTPRAASEEALDALVADGIRGMVVRPSPSVHGEGDHGFVPMLIELAKKQGRSAYVGGGHNRWNAVHRLDAAKVYVGALDLGRPGERFHAVAEQEVAFEQIAQAIGRGLQLPVVSLSEAEATAHFQWLAWAVALDWPASSAITQQRLGWHPVQPTLLDDLASGVYFR